MKRLLFALSLLLTVNGYSQEARSFTLTPNSTTVATATTNTTAGTIQLLDHGESPLRIYVSATGTAATTNGALTIKFSTASGNGNQTNAFDTASLSNIKLVMSNGINSVSTAVVQSDWFVTSGARYIRVGQVENTYLGNVSNLTITVGYPFGVR
jgi:hypothetical protein